MVKEELVEFDGTPLFPERQGLHGQLHAVRRRSRSVRGRHRVRQNGNGQGRSHLAGQRKGSVGFALTALQRRLASSPEAIFQSLKRRRERLEKRLREEKIGERGRTLLAETLGCCRRRMMTT